MEDCEVELMRPKTVQSRAEGGVSHIVVAISEGRGVSSDVGMTSFNLSTSECILSQFSDNAMFASVFSRLHCLNPSQIIVSSSCVETRTTKLYAFLQEMYEHDPDVSLEIVDRQYWNKGTQILNEYGLKASEHLFTGLINQKFFCLASLSAIFYFIETYHNITFQQHSINFRVQPVNGTMMIDSITARNLELISNLVEKKNTRCLLGYMNHCQTAMGYRLLRTTILQPLLHKETIEARLNCVDELVNNESLFYSVKESLKNVPDIDFSITAFIQARKPSVKNTELAINNIIVLKSILEDCFKICESLAGAGCVLLRAVKETIGDQEVVIVQAEINCVINEDITLQSNPLGLRNQRVYAVKSGLNPLLDVARQTYKESTDDVHDLVTMYIGESWINSRRT